MLNYELNQKGFIVDYDENKIQPITYGEFLSEFGSDLTTSPLGVEHRYFVSQNDDTYEVRRWNPSGRSSLVETFDTEEEAELSILKDMEEEAWEKSCFYEDKGVAIADLAERLDKNIDVIARYINIKEECTRREAIKREELRIKQIAFREAQNAAIEAEASLIDADDEFRAEVKEVNKNAQGSKKAALLSNAFQKLLARTGHGKIRSDYWKVFRIVSKK